MTVQRIKHEGPDKMVAVTVLVPLTLRTRLNVAAASRNTSVQKILTPTIERRVVELEAEESAA